MRTIIETGRQTSPVINDSLAALEKEIASFGGILSDLASVKSEGGRAAILAKSADELDCLVACFNAAAASWRRFDSTLRDYKYVFGSHRKGPPPDLPGQEVMAFAEDGEKV